MLVSPVLLQGIVTRTYRFDARIGGQVAAATAKRLVAARRLGEAEAFLEAISRVWPGDRRIIAAAAQVAAARGDHQEAARRWRQARSLGDNGAFCISRLSASLRSLGEHAAAQILIDDALVHFPRAISILTEAARLAQDGDRPQDALAYWRRAIIRAQPHADWLEGYSRCLILTGNLEWASRVIRSARRQYPDDLGLIAADGLLSTKREDWPRAIALWTEYRRLSLDDAHSWEALGHACHGMQLSAVESLETTPKRTTVAALDDEPKRQLMLGFESIGNNCELGLVQRRFGAEPLGLLRWNEVALEKLVTALACGMEGMGEPANTVIKETACGELFVMDRRWSLSMHTFSNSKQVDVSSFSDKMCRRIVYLRKKFMEDIRSAEKIFVYRSPSFDIESLKRLHRALLNHGPVVLLGVQPILTAQTSFAGQQVGQVMKLDDRLFVGFLAHEANIETHEDYDIDFETWTALLTRVRELAPAQP